MLNRVGELVHTTSRSTFDCDLRKALDEKGKKTDAFWGMNRQFVRTSILLKLLKGLDIDAFVETGTHRGATCFLIASQTTLPIYSSEVNSDYFRFAQRLLLPFGKRIHLFNGDSVVFLKEVLQAKRFRKPFVYLDAHWYEKLPLRDELRTILSNCQDFVIAVDDFVVPHDPGFGYDVYNGAPLNLELVKDVLSGSGVHMSVWFPSYSSQLETGRRRGWTLFMSQTDEDQVRDLIPTELLSLHMQV
jgi:predicted O-methyltransferase YrrM